MQRHRPFLFLLLLGYHASALASPVSHIRPHQPVHKKSHARIATRPMPHSPVKPPRTRVINTLMAQLGKPYRWGGISPETGFDCSGLVYYAWRKNFNTRLPRTAEGMYSMAQAHPVQFQHLEPGDMVFFAMKGGDVDHVGVYLGNGHFIEAPHTGQNVKIVSLEQDNYRRHYRGARRLPVPGAGPEES
ncbi:C40 family peptidase [Enterobacter asburiae]|uniref:C40 family peptidase n=1 Tax=Enterobacter asburiae TaxID=61645 RepID=UPI003BF90DB3|nr:C40 family peptidase [Enterobacter asburiae]